MHNHHPTSPPSPSKMNSIQESSTSIWDWSQFVDFNIDDHLPLPTEEETDNSPRFQELFQIANLAVEREPEHVSDLLPLRTAINNNDKVQKRDPRMACPNFQAGRIPCACPELDAQLDAEEEAGAPGKKKTVIAKALTNSRCQVSGCERDISELKGYHKRRRVCLRCANANTVVLDGQNKRYCQQCGKFLVKIHWQILLLMV
ncbi:putative transcription factor SBP family [Helianthus annuus]|nr:putative transcription factor SBP family [Helianthus annuus]